MKWIFSENLRIDGMLSDLAIERAARDRARAIFEDKIHWSDPFNVNRYGQEKWMPQPFTLVPTQFIASARRFRPLHPEPTVSGFSSWIYSLYKRDDPDPKSMREGIAAEKAIFEERQRSGLARAVLAASNPEHLAREDGTWRLFHNGLNLCRTTRQVPPIVINHLTVNGCALRGSPDLAFVNESTGHIILVEIKFSRKRIPSNLWPNVWAQLWCYSQIPTAVAAPGVTIIGEVWGGRSELIKTYHAESGRRVRTVVPNVHLRRTVRKDPRAASFDRFFAKLFDIYRGTN